MLTMVLSRSETSCPQPTAQYGQTLGTSRVLWKRERRFSARARWILAVVSLTAYVFTKVSVNVYAGALVFQALLPDTFGTPENAFWVGAFSTVVLTHS